ncbi:MAG: AMP-binding protein [Bacteroidetes bacterium]|nr:AMP-binding protein [Bacteroidota bacterium]
MFQPELERMPRERLQTLQLSRLQSLLRRLAEKVPFYQQQFGDIGFNPGDLQRLEDLQHLPFTNKEDLRTHYPFGLFAEPIEHVARIHASSGTTGKLTVVGYTANDLRIFGEVCARSLAAAGAKAGMMLHNAYGYGLFTGGLGLHAGAETLGLTVVPVSGGMTDRQIDLLLDFKPQILSCTPSYALTLAEACRHRGIAPDQLQLRFALLGAEPWTNTLREQVEAGLGVIATNIYGLSEIMGPGVAQEAFDEKGTGSYVWEDHFYPEIVDAQTGKVLPDGQPGVLVFTTLTKEALPLLRYKTGDITWLRRDHDGARTHVKMGPVLGRADDMLIVRGVNLFPSQVEAVLEEFPQLAAHYQLCLKRERTLDEIEVQVEWLEDVERSYGPPEGTGQQAASGLTERLHKRLKERLGLSIRVELVAVGQLPRSEGGKTRHVVDLRRQ